MENRRDEDYFRRLLMRPFSPPVPVPERAQIPILDWPPADGISTHNWSGKIFNNTLVSDKDL